MFPGSHLLPFWTNKNKPNVTGYGKTLILSEGEIVLFHSTLVHAGAASCDIEDNFSCVEAEFKKEDQEKYEEIKWFGKDTSQTITDMSIHFTVEPAGAMVAEAVYGTGGVEIFTTNYNHRVEAEEGKERKEWLEKSRQYREAKKEGLKNYKLMTMPGEADESKPGGFQIAEVDRWLERYKYGEKGQANDGSNRSKGSWCMCSGAWGVKTGKRRRGKAVVHNVSEF